MPSLTYQDAFTGLMGISTGTVKLISWLLVPLVHFSALSLFLLAAWLFQWTPQEVRAAVESLVPSWLASSVAGTTAFLGISALAAGTAYVRAWQWLIGRLANWYVMRFLR